MKDSTVAQDAMRVAEQMKMAVGHIEHMSNWIAHSNKGLRQANYHFEALGEDLPNIKDAMMIAQTIDGKVATMETELACAKSEAASLKATNATLNNTLASRDAFIKTLQEENARLMGALK